MPKLNPKLIYWPTPPSGGRSIKYRPPKFEQYSGKLDSRYVDLIRILNEVLCKMKGSYNDPGSRFRYSHELKSLLIEDPKCGPSVEFYFYRYVPFLHAYIYDLNANTYKKYKSFRKHFLLTATDEFINKFMNGNNEFKKPFMNRNNIYPFYHKPFHNDGRRIYQLKLNLSTLYCKESETKFLSITDFFNLTIKNPNINQLWPNIEMFLFEQY